MLQYKSLDDDSGLESRHEISPSKAGVDSVTRGSAVAEVSSNTPAEFSKGQGALAELSHSLTYPLAIFSTTDLGIAQLFRHSSWGAVAAETNAVPF